MNKILTKEALAQELTVKEWLSIQNYHDYVASTHNTSAINARVARLERATDLKFPELYFGS